MEQFKIGLAKCQDFNLIDAFGMLDTDGRGYISAAELHEGLNACDMVLSVDDCRLFLQRYNTEQDGLLKYSEFSGAFLPLD